MHARTYAHMHMHMHTHTHTHTSLQANALMHGLDVDHGNVPLELRVMRLVTDTGLQLLMVRMSLSESVSEFDSGEGGA